MRMPILTHWLMLAVVLAGFGPLAGSQAQPGAGRATRNYDPKTETNIKGTIEEVKQTTGKHGWSGMHLLVTTASGTFDVHVGPSDYIAQRQFSFAKGDQIEVTGSKIQAGETATLIAREIKTGGQTLTLRDAQGIPSWAGGRRR